MKNEKQTIFILALLGLIIILQSCKGVETMPENTTEQLIVKSASFDNNGFMPEKYTGRGEDISPEINLQGISSNAKSIAIVMDDLDIPFIKAFTHWVIWNIPVQETIPEGIPKGEIVEVLGGAIQGIAYGKHEYKGPKPPRFIRKAHRYKFNIYVLDCIIELDSNSKKKDLMKAMDSHIIQYGNIIGLYKNK